MDGSSWVVGTNQIMYLNPANTMETVLIVSQLIKYSSKNLTVEMQMWNETRTQIKAMLWVNLENIYILFGMYWMNLHNNAQGTQNSGVGSGF